MTDHPSVIIRPAKNSDFKGISGCYWDDPETPWDIYTNPRLLKRLIGPGGFIVAEADSGHIVGFVHYHLFRKSPWFDPKVRKYGQVLELHVKDEFQERGIGRRLMRQAVEKLEDEGCKRIYVNTDETNIAALNLYRTLGFRPFLKTFYLVKKTRLSR